MDLPDECPIKDMPNPQQTQAAIFRVQLLALVLTLALFCIPIVYYGGRFAADTEATRQRSVELQKQIGDLHSDVEKMFVDVMTMKLQVNTMAPQIEDLTRWRIEHGERFLDKEREKFHKQSFGGPLPEMRTAVREKGDIKSH